MTDMPTPTALSGELSYKQLHQITVSKDDDIEVVNKLLADGWKLVSIGHLANATVYVLGRFDERPHRSAGFLKRD